MWARAISRQRLQSRIALLADTVFGLAGCAGDFGIHLLLAAIATTSVVLLGRFRLSWRVLLGLPCRFCSRLLVWLSMDRYTAQACITRCMQCLIWALLDIRAAALYETSWR